MAAVELVGRSTVPLRGAMFFQFECLILTSASRLPANWPSRCLRVPEHPDSGFDGVALTTQLRERPEEQRLPRTPTEEPVDQAPPALHDLARQAHKGALETVEFHALHR